jgi:hypothetical protein
MDIAALEDSARAGRDDALQQLTFLAGGQSMCAIGRSGVGYPAAKYQEGRSTAFADAARLLAKGGTVADLEAMREAWAARRAAAPEGDWLAYWAGGADALEGLLEG